MTLRLRTSLLAVLLAVSLPLAAVLLFCLFFWTKSEQVAAQERDARLAAEITLTITAVIDEGRRVLETVAGDQTMVWEERPLDARLAAYATAFPFSRGVVAMHPSGAPISPVWVRETGFNVSDRPWFREVLEHKRFVAGPFVISRLTGAPVLPLGLPVLRRARVEAVLALSIDLSWVYRQAQSHGLPDGSTINLIGPDHMVLVRYPDPTAFVGKVYGDLPMVKAAADATDLSVIKSPGLDGRQRLYVIQPLRAAETFLGSVAVGIPLNMVHRSSSTALITTWTVFALVVVLGGIASVIGMRTLVTRPLRLIGDHALEVARGQFASRVGLGRLPPELAALGDSVNRMAAALEARDAELSRYRDHLEDTIEERTKELLASRTELERSNAELQQFAYVASHDLQEPLRMVASFTQLLAQKYEGALDGQAQQYIAFAVDGATRMQQLINDLLAYSRIETQAHELGQVASSEALQLALINLGALIQTTGAQVDAGNLPPVVADPTQLCQVFQNLVGNAVKFNRSKPPRVWVSADVKDGQAVFRVDDNGIGISPEFAERVFVIFQRLNPRSEFPGTGIGLALCKRIVDRHGGKIWFETGAHGGTCFVFTLPVPRQGDARA